MPDGEVMRSKRGNTMIKYRQDWYSVDDRLSLTDEESEEVEVTSYT